jgi:hypothetical protein
MPCSQFCLIISKIIRLIMFTVCTQYRVKFQHIFKMLECQEGVEWINMAEERDKWCHLVNVVINCMV